MSNENNITNVQEEDKVFIEALIKAPVEKKILLKGIFIGIDFAGINLTDYSPGQTQQTA